MFSSSVSSAFSCSRAEVSKKAKGLDNRVLVGESLVRRRDERHLYLVLGQVWCGAFFAAVLVVAPPDDLAVLVRAVPDFRLFRKVVHGIGFLR